MTDTTTLAEQLAHTTLVRILSRAEDAQSGADGQWRNPGIRDAFIGVARHIVIIDAPGRIRADAPRTRNGYIWAYLGREALTVAARKHLADGTYTIANLDPYTYVLTYTA